MPTFRTPLFGSYNNRSFSAVSGKDQLFKGCIVTPVVNQQSRMATYYVEKRGGIGNGIFTPAAGSTPIAFYLSPSLFKAYELFNNGGTVTLYENATSCGVILTGATSPTALITTEVILGGVTYVLFTIKATSVAQTGWYLASDATTNTAYTCDGNNSTTITDLKVAGVPSVAGLYVGQKLSAASNIVAGSRIVSINTGAFSAVLDTATTGGAFNDLATTKEPVAKIIDSDFPTNSVGGFAELDGYVFIMTDDSKVFNSDLNSVSAWTAGNFFPCTKYSDKGLGVTRYGDRIMAFSNASLEALYNAGNAAGSPLSSSDQSKGWPTGSAPPSSAASICQAEGNVWWIGADANLYSMNGFTPQRNPLGSSALVSTAIITSFYYNKKTYLNIRLSSTSNLWYCVTDGFLLDPNFSAGAFMASNGYLVLEDTSGKVYFMDASSSAPFTDNGSSYTMSIQIQTDMGTQKRKFPSELRLICDVQSSGAIDVSYSDDDGSNFSTPISMPVTSIAEMFIPGSMLGSWEGTRLWKFGDAGNNAQRIKMLEIDHTVEK